MLEPAVTKTPVISEIESGWIEALRDGDEDVFGKLVDLHHGALVRFATSYVANASVAEEVVQETWVAFVQGLDRFEGRCSLKTWLFRTLINCCRSRRRKEVRSIPFSTAFDPDEVEPSSVPGDRFQASGPWAGHWAAAPRSFGADGERALLQRELLVRVEQAVQLLPPAQREVITLRDIEGFDAQEVCEVLDLTEANQRVLLHRARSKVRTALETYLHPDIAGPS